MGDRHPVAVGLVTVGRLGTTPQHELHRHLHHDRLIALIGAVRRHALDFAGIGDRAGGFLVVLELLEAGGVVEHLHIGAGSGGVRAGEGRLPQLPLVLLLLLGFTGVALVVAASLLGEGRGQGNDRPGGGEKGEQQELGTHGTYPGSAGETLAARGTIALDKGFSVTPQRRRAFGERIGALAVLALPLSGTISGEQTMKAASRRWRLLSNQPSFPT